MIKRGVGRQLNWFDEDYFWYGDDLDLCFRVKKVGYKVMFLPEVEILHYKGVASGLKKHSQEISKADREVRKMATQARFEVMRIFYRKHYQNKYPYWLTGLVLAGIWLRQKMSEVAI